MLRIFYIFFKTNKLILLASGHLSELLLKMIHFL